MEQPMFNTAEDAAAFDRGEFCDVSEAPQQNGCGFPLQTIATSVGLLSATTGLVTVTSGLVQKAIYRRRVRKMSKEERDLERRQNDPVFAMVYGQDKKIAELISKVDTTQRVAIRTEHKVDDVLDSTGKLHHKMADMQGDMKSLHDKFDRLIEADAGVEDAEAEEAVA